MDTNKEIGRRIKMRREQLGLTLEELGNSIWLNKSTIMRYENGEVKKIKLPILHALAKQLNVDPLWLALKTDEMGSFIERFDIFSIPNISPIPKMKKVPRLGTIACGEPILAEQNIDGYDLIDAEIHCDFSLTCQGDSMINARIFDGDVVFIRQQPDVDNGEIAAVLIDGEATLKKVYKYPDRLVLRPCNPMYEDFVYTGEELENIRILGKAIIFKSYVRNSK